MSSPQVSTLGDESEPREDPFKLLVEHDLDEEDGYKRSINLGNTCTKEQFDIMSAQLYKLLVVFLDVKTHKGGPNCNDFLSH